MEPSVGAKQIFWSQQKQLVTDANYHFWGREQAGRAAGQKRQARSGDFSLARSSPPKCDIIPGVYAEVFRGYPFVGPPYYEPTMNIEVSPT
ncbi:hypothetical protein M407DRAFT_243765 [Tulasnella calospora MUT 4182]|uniref:Uncharacterized protein n=1 Tax=Tulasnella calospora MUT 4182 TaxID=1051891 RepID=A0A0C3KY22_9AGAM|nr:hypothetical protein M407DRAFT_243765 [Tulasnella calospora MUT 4182]